MNLRTYLASFAVAGVFLLGLAVSPCPGGDGSAKAPAPVHMFLDTDVCVDAGDVAAITCLNGLADKAEVDIIGITCVTSCPFAPGCVDAVCHWCKRRMFPSAR